MDERVARAHDVRGGVDELVRLQRGRARGDLAPRDAREALLVRIVPAARNLGGPAFDLGSDFAGTARPPPARGEVRRFGRAER